MTFADFLAQASFWQWFGMFMCLAAIGPSRIVRKIITNIEKPKQ